MLLVCYTLCMSGRSQCKSSCLSMIRTLNFRALSSNPISSFFSLWYNTTESTNWILLVVITLNGSTYQKWFYNWFSNNISLIEKTGIAELLLSLNQCLLGIWNLIAIHKIQTSPNDLRIFNISSQQFSLVVRFFIVTTRLNWARKSW